MHILIPLTTALALSLWPSYLDHQGTPWTPLYLEHFFHVEQESAIYSTRTAEPVWILFFLCIPLPGASSIFLIDHFQRTFKPWIFNTHGLILGSPLFLFSCFGAGIILL